MSTDMRLEFKEGLEGWEAWIQQGGVDICCVGAGRFMAQCAQDAEENLEELALKAAATRREYGDR